MQRAICGPMHPQTLNTMHMLAVNYDVLGRAAESRAMFEKLLAFQREKGGEDVFTQKDVGKCLRLLGRNAEAVTLLSKIDKHDNGWVSCSTVRCRAPSGTWTCTGFQWVASSLARASYRPSR